MSSLIRGVRAQVRRAGERGRAAWKRAGDGLLAAGAFLASLALYLQTMAPSVAALFDDSLEFPLVVHRLAIAHPTGYPLYTLLGRLLALGPWHNVAWSVNLLSAFAGAFTVAFAFLAGRALTRRRWPALVGAAALALSPIFWSQSVVAEVYTLNSALVAALLWTALRWAGRPLAPIHPFSLLYTPPPPPGASAALTSETPAAGEPVKSEPPEVEAQGDNAGADEATPTPPAAGGRLRAGAAAISAAARHVGRVASQAVCRVRTAGGVAALWVRAAVRPVARYLGTAYRRAFPAVPVSRRLRPHPRLYVLCALFGLGLAHHRTILLLAPALLLYVLLVERRVFSRAALLGPEDHGRPAWLRLAGRPAVILAACTALPLLLYLYLPIRGHVGSLDGTYTNTWSGFWRWVLARDYGGFLGENPLARHLDALFYAGLFWQQFGPVGLALGLVGVVGLARQPRALILTGLAFVAYMAFAVVYRVPDVEVFFIPAFLLGALWIAVGLDHALDMLRIRGRSLALRRLLAGSRLVLVVAALAGPVTIGVCSYPDVDLSRRWIVHDYAHYVLEQPFAPQSTVVGLLGEMTLLRYFQETAGLASHVRTVVADDPSTRLEVVREAIREGGDVYVTRSLSGLAADYSMAAILGPIDVLGHTEALVRVGTPTYEVPPLPNRLGLEPVPGLELLGYETHEHQAHWQAWLRLRLWWRAPQGLGSSLKVSAVLLDATGNRIAAVDGEPVAWTYPTTAWRAGEVVTDVYEIRLPAGTPPGPYTLLLVIYDPISLAEQGRAELPAVSLTGTLVRPPRHQIEAELGRTVHARFGEVELLGYTAPHAEAAQRAGGALPLTLLWQAKENVRVGLQVTLWLEAGAEPVATEGIVGGPYGSMGWRRGDVVRQALILHLPPGLKEGTYSLKLRVTRDGRPLPWGRGLVPLGSDLELGRVRVAP